MQLTRLYTSVGDIFVVWLPRHHTAFGCVHPALRPQCMLPVHCSCWFHPSELGAQIRWLEQSRLCFLDSILEKCPYTTTMQRTLSSTGSQWPKTGHQKKRYIQGPEFFAPHECKHEPSTRLKASIIRRPTCAGLTRPMRLCSSWLETVTRKSDVYTLRCRQVFGFNCSFFLPEAVRCPGRCRGSSSSNSPVLQTANLLLIIISFCCHCKTSTVW